MCAGVGTSTIALIISNDYCDIKMGLPSLFRIQIWLILNLVICILFLLSFLVWGARRGATSDALGRWTSQIFLYLYFLAVAYVFFSGCISFVLHCGRFSECTLPRLRSSDEDFFVIFALGAWILHVFLICIFLRIVQLFLTWEYNVTPPVEVEVSLSLMDNNRLHPV